MSIRDRLSRLVKLDWGKTKDGFGFKLDMLPVVFVILFGLVVLGLLLLAVPNAESSFLSKPFMEWLLEARVWEVLLTVVIITWITKD